jgi:uncharacterized integral membrane protein
MIRFFLLLLLIPVIVFIAAFTYRNAGPVNIDLFTVEYTVPLAALLLIAMLVGIVLGFLVNLLVFMKQKNKIRQLIKQRDTLSSLSDAFKVDK